MEVAVEPSPRASASGPRVLVLAVTLSAMVAGCNDDARFVSGSTDVDAGADRDASGEADTLDARTGEDVNAAADAPRDGSGDAREDAADDPGDGRPDGPPDAEDEPPPDVDDVRPDAGDGLRACPHERLPLAAAPPGDCNDDGVDDTLQIDDGQAFDCDDDGILDECQLIDDACVWYGRRRFIEYDAGNLPIVISMPHGGLVRPDDIPDRAAATGSRDVNTIQVGRAVADALFEQTGRHPHLIINQLHRDKLDANRDLDIAQDGHSETVTAWREYHAAIDAAKRAAMRDFGGALYIDLHGLVASRDKIEIGYLLTAAQLYRNDDRLDHPGHAYRSSLRTLALRDGAGPFSALIRGFDSLGGHLQAAGFDTVPSPAHPDPGFDDDGSPGNYFNGGYNTARHGSRGGGPVSGLQIELTWEGVRDTPDARAAFGDALATGLLDYVDHWLDIDPTARARVEVFGTDPGVSERGDEGEVTFRRSGDTRASIEVAVDWSGSAITTAEVWPLPSTIAFDAGEAVVRVPIIPRLQASDDAPDLLSVEVVRGPGYNVGAAAGATVHVGDAHAVGVWLEAPEPTAEGDEATLVVRRDACGRPLDVPIVIAGSAIAEVDYTIAGLDEARVIAHFGASDSAASLRIETFVDASLEGRERVMATVDGVDAVGPGAEPASAVLEIVDAEGPDTPVLWWPSVVDAGVLRDQAAGAADGDLLPSPDTGPVRMDSGGPADGTHLRFDGDDDLVIGPDLDLGAAFTVAFWFAVAADLPDGFRYMYSHGLVTREHHVNVYVLDDGRIRSSVRGLGDESAYDALDSPAGYRDAAWHHYALAVDTSEAPAVAAVYLDGVEVASGARGGASVDPDTDIYLGGRWDIDPDRDFRGGLHDVRLYARTLSAPEVAALAAGEE